MSRAGFRAQQAKLKPEVFLSAVAADAGLVFSELDGVLSPLRFQENGINSGRLWGFEGKALRHSQAKTGPARTEVLPLWCCNMAI